MYLEDESHSYHISSLMDRKMKGEKLDGNLEKGFGMLRKDNQPQRARSLSLSSKKESSIDSRLELMDCSKRAYFQKIFNEMLDNAEMLVS